MIHTINTGHERDSPRSEVSAAALAAVRPLLRPGRRPVPGMAGYALAVAADGGALLATVYGPGDRPCVTFGVAADAGAAGPLWAALERQYLALTDLPGLRAADFRAPRPPSGLPWVSAMTILATPDEAGWIADLERCVAWAWIDSLTPRAT